jgi:hypothetical protein
VKKLLILLATGCLPFLLVWIGFFLTGFSYNPISVFQSGGFWGVSILYWLLWICITPLILEIIDEHIPKEEQPKPFTKEEMIQKHLSAEKSRQNPQYEEFVRDAMNKLK